VQRRYVDRGRPYDHEAWRTLLEVTNPVGVYSGFDLSPSTVVGSQIIAASGGLMLPSGIVVVETEEVTVDLGSGFPPAATNYTVCTLHEEANVGLISGEAMTYYVTAALLTSQPTNGVILGWIRHPGGSIPLAASHITDAPKNRDLAQDMAARTPFRQTPPHFVVPSLVTDMAEVEGYDTRPWRGFNYAVTAGRGNAQVTAYVAFPVYAEPWQVNITTILPVGALMYAYLYDTAGASAGSNTFTAHATYTTNILSVTPGSNTWTSGSTGLLKFIFDIPRGTTVQMANLEVDFWPYALPRT